MNSYFEPDVTGQAADCLITDYVIQLFKEDQVVEFSMPVYYDSIVIQHFGTEITLLKDEDYQIKSLADTEMAEIRGAIPDWNKVLVKSIIISNSNVSNTRLQVAYQQLFPDALTYNRYRGVNIELTPSLIQKTVDRLWQLEQSIKNSYPVSGFDSLSVPYRLLPVDITGANPNNLIIDEEHTIDTLHGKNLVIPTHGSFFDHDLVITNVTTNLALEKDIDYSFVSFNSTKTKVATSRTSVYEFIRINKEMTGKVRIRYRAFGGMPSLDDFKKMYDNLNHVVDFLSHNSFMTEHTFGTYSGVIEIYNKITDLENKMRQLEIGSTYGDVTTGTSATKKIRAIDNNIHWWNIASLYKVQGSDALIDKGIFKFALELKNTGIQLTGSVVVNLKEVNPDNRVNVSVDNNSSNCDACKIHARVIYNQVVNGYSGAILQIGFALSEFLQDTIGVEDLSGKESCWKLTPTSASVVDAQDNSVTLPDGISIWTTTGNISKSIIKPLILKTGVSITSTETAVTVNASTPTVILNRFSLDDSVFNEITSGSTEMSITLDGIQNDIVVYMSAWSMKTETDFSIEMTGHVVLWDGNTYTITCKVKNTTTSIFFRRQEAEANEVPSVFVRKVKLFR